MSALRITSIEEAGPRADLGPVSFETTPAGGARWHPYADLFPWIEGAALAEFYADVARNGVRQPIVFLDGQILDGRNRYMAARQAGLEYPRCDYVGSDPLGFVVSHNLTGRRHLTESQRAMIAAKLATLGVGRPASLQPQPGSSPVGGRSGEAESAETARRAADFDRREHLMVDRISGRSLGEAGSSETNPPIGGISTEAAAAALNVGARSIERAKTVREHGAPELVAAVERGDAAVAAAEAIARLPQARQEEILAEVAKSADGRRAFARVAKEARRERQETKKNARAVREEILGKRQARLPEAKFGVILADPEWQFQPRSRASGMDRAADNHYPTSSLEVIRSRDVPSIAADDCVLFLWATAPMLPQALEVLSAWGFTYRSHRVWRKAESTGAGLVLGTGYWFRNAHELVLVGTRGNVPAPAMGTQYASIFDARPRKHSEKPDDIHEMIEALFPTLPKIELNARRRREGWEPWGFEAPAAEPVPAPRVEGQTDIEDFVRAPVEAADPPPVLPLKGGGEAKAKRAARAPKKDEWTLRKERIASRAEAILAATRGDLDEMIADYLETLGAGHDAALAGDDEAWLASCERRDALLLAANGLDPIGAAVNERPVALLAASRAVPGVAPLWGQGGVFRVEVDGTPVLVTTGDRGFAGSVDLGLHAESFVLPFPSESGYRSVPSVHPREGMTLDAVAAEIFRAHMKDKPNEGWPPGPYYPDRVYAPTPAGELVWRDRGVAVDLASPPAGYDWPAILALFEEWRGRPYGYKPKTGERKFPKCAHGNTKIIALSVDEPLKPAVLVPVGDYPVAGVYVVEKDFARRTIRLVRDGANPEGPAE